MAQEACMRRPSQKFVFQRVYDIASMVEECVANVLKQTDELRRSAAEFSDYARLPEPEVRPTDIGRLLSETAAAYAGSRGGPRPHAARPKGDPCPMRGALEGQGRRRELRLPIAR